LSVVGRIVPLAALPVTDTHVGAGFVEGVASFSLAKAKIS
jgi:hypothetical protein